MCRCADWSYVQARLQARHGERSRDSEWGMLEAAKTLDHFLVRSHSTPLRRFTVHMNAQMTSHRIESILRAKWRDYVAEVAAWPSAAWRPAVLWGAHVPDLIVLDRLLAGDAPPDWTRDDPVFGPLVGADRQTPAARLEKSRFSPLSSAKEGGGGLAECWLAHWRALLPRGCGADCRCLMSLAELVKVHIRRLAQAGPEETSGPRRRDLADALTRMFRRYSGTPVAVFCHLALVALDLERLRGNLVRRRLFGTEEAKGAI